MKMQASKIVSVHKVDIEPLDIVREYSYTSVPDDLGKHASSMELFWIVPFGEELDIKNGAGTIEWDIPALEETVHIGVWTEDGALVDYDGVFCLPAPAVKFLRDCGIAVDREEWE